VPSAATQTSASVASLAEVHAQTHAEEKLVARSFADSLASVPEMYRRTLAAISPLVDFPFSHFPLCSCPPPPVTDDVQVEVSKKEGLTGIDNDRGTAVVVDKEEEKVQEEMEQQEAPSPSSDGSPWVLKPSVGSWLIPLYAKEKAMQPVSEVEAAPAEEEEPKAAEVTQPHRKGLGSRAKAWFCCTQAAAAEPTMAPPNAAAKPKSPKAKGMFKSKRYSGRR